MRNKGATTIVYNVGRGMTGVSAVSIIALGLLPDVDPQQSPYNTWPAIALSAVKFLNDWSLILYGIMGAMFALGWMFKTVGDPWIWEKIQHVVDGIDEGVFRDLPRDRENRHRVTLFQRKKFFLWVRQPGSHWSWPYGKGGHPWSGWLVPVLRSGHTAQSSGSVFYAPSDKKSHKTEGVVGQAWAENRTIIVDKLPDIQQNGTDVAKNRYAKKTWCAVDLVDRYANRKQPPPRSIGAVPVEIRGKVWGALVFDSKAPEGITDKKAKQYTLTISLIGHLLERA